MDASRQNLKTLAESLGLSPSTVSRVLSGNGERYRISEATRKRVLEAAEASGLVVNQLARGLRLQTTFTLGLVIPDISNPFFASLARQVERSARQRGFSVVLADSQESTEVEIELLRNMESRRVDGLVIAPVGVRCEHLSSLRSTGYPMVQVDRLFDEVASPMVCSDNPAGAKLAVEELVAHGHRRIACIQGLPESSANRERVRGYQEGLSAAGIEPDPGLLAGGDYESESGRLGAFRLMGLDEPPTALLTLGNMLALGAMQALREMGRRIPSDVSLITFDDQPWAELIDPPLTTVAQPLEDLGETAVKLLFEEMDRDEGVGMQRITLPVELVRRSSVSNVHVPN